MAKESYNYVVSLGYNCEIANALQLCNARDASYPFDWTFTNMSTATIMFRDRFTNFFIRDQLAKARYTDNPAMQHKGGIIFVHDGKYDYLLKDDQFYKTQKEKYDRRTSRLMEILDSGKSVLFVRYAYDDTHQEHIDFIKMLESVYPKSVFKLMVVNMICHENDEKRIRYMTNTSLTRNEIGTIIRTNYNVPVHNSIKKEY